LAHAAEPRLTAPHLDLRFHLPLLDTTSTPPLDQHRSRTKKRSTRTVWLVGCLSNSGTRHREIDTLVRRLGRTSLYSSLPTSLRPEPSTALPATTQPPPPPPPPPPRSPLQRAPRGLIALPAAPIPHNHTHPRVAQHPPQSGGIAGFGSANTQGGRPPPPSQSPKGNFQAPTFLWQNCREREIPLNTIISDDVSLQSLLSALSQTVDTD
jgi:hypothetical protein